MSEVTIIKRDARANGVGKSGDVYHYDEAVRQIEQHFDEHPEGYVELVFPARTRYAFYREQAVNILYAAFQR